MSADHIKTYNENARKHNKRVQSIRENRLPKSCVEALDGAIKAMDVINFQIKESIVHNYNCIGMDDMIQLGLALENMKAEFQERELK
ncbi:hypothetical protein [uncultured Mediterranean phage uvMED]|nr:hypothetical protein [uncultured Mediterranean phage uvMED]